MDQMLILVMGLFAIIAIETLVVIFVFMKTPAGVFLKASMFKQSIMYIMNKDKMAKFITFKSKNGAAKAGKEGVYGLTENSATIEVVSKCPLYLSFRDMAASLDPMYPAIIQELREAGHKIENIEDLRKLIKNIEEGTEENYEVKVKSFKTYKVHDLTNMFPVNLDPTFIDASVQHEIAQGLRMMKAGPMVMGGVIVLLIVAAVSVYIMRQAFQGSISTQECQAMVSAAKCGINTMAAATGNPPIV